MRREADQSRTDVVQGLTQSYCASTSASTVGMRGRVALARATNGARSGRRIAAHERVLAITGSLPLRFDAVVHAAARQTHAREDERSSRSRPLLPDESSSLRRLARPPARLGRI